MDIEAMIHLFEQSSVFSKLPVDELRIVASYSETEDVKKDGIIFSPGDPGTRLFIIAEGSVSIYNEDPQKSEVIARFKAGEGFGELDFFCANSRSAYAVAERDSVLLSFPGKGKTLDHLLSDEPRLTANLMHKFIDAVADRIRVANDLARENSAWVRELRNQMYTDKLTGLYNKTYLDEKLGDHHKDAGLSLLMIKPDNFKIINDTFGHDAGDTAIQVIAHAVRDLCESGEIPVRFMGNEFAVILPMMNREGAAKRARDFQEKVCSLDFTEAIGPAEVSLTASVGVCVISGKQPDFKKSIELTHELAMKGRTIGGRKIQYVE